MRSLPITEKRHILLEIAFKEWLEVTGYSSSSAYDMPARVREFLYWLEQERKELDKVQSKDLETYFFQLKQRKKERRTGALSNNYLLKHLQALKLLSHYLRETDQGMLEVDVVLEGQKRRTPDILTKEEIKQLYEETDNGPLGLRDRAMLAIYYGCGLRRSEGVSLDTTDFQKEKGLLYVRKGKNLRERYVPMTEEVKQDLADYLHYGRQFIVKDSEEKAFFLSEKGERLQGQSLNIRLEKLVKRAEITKEVTLHTLRHSIATHLLESGMSLPNIGRFLGHESLESTQIYTHIVHEQ